MPNKLGIDITAAERKAFEKLSGLAVGSGLDMASGIDLLAGDGSERRFLRVHGDQRSLILILPSRSSLSGLAESRSTWLIGNHLRRCGTPVPEFYGYDPETGIIACEDLGDLLLYDKIADVGRTEDELLSIYGRIIENLIQMQVAGGVGFKSEWCWQTGEYNRELMLSRESAYFMEAFCRDFLGIGKSPTGIEKDFEKLADLASESPAGFFLHRDFQSRNIMFYDGHPRFIDFQGGRFGPLGYDLASLLIDPYVSLSVKVQERLLQKYIEVLAEYPDAKNAFSLDSYFYLALQRNLQILGAFAFLSQVKGKSFFRKFLAPALTSLNRLLGEPQGRRFPVLRDFAGELGGRLGEQSG